MISGEKAEAIVKFAADSPMSDAAFRVFSVLALYAVGDIPAPDNFTLGALVHKSEQDIDRCITELRDSGWLKALGGEARP